MFSFFALAQDSNHAKSFGTTSFGQDGKSSLGAQDECVRTGGIRDAGGNCFRQGPEPEENENESTTTSGNQQFTCESVTQKAMSDCNFEGNSQVQGVMGLAGQLKNSFDQMVAANPQLACSKLGQLSSAASLASGAFNTTCSASHGRCQSTCESELEMARGTPAEDGIRQALRECQSLQRNLNAGLSNIMQFAQVSQNMSFCKTETGDTFEEYCKKTPNDPFCAKRLAATDCSNPTVAATNTICICQRNPNDPKCGTVNNFASKSTADGAGTGAGSELENFGIDSPNFGGGVNDPGVAQPAQRPNGDLGLGSSGRGGIGGLNSGGNNAYQAPQGGGGGSGLNTKIVSGYGVGGRGGAGSGFSAGGSGNAPSGRPGSLSPGAGGAAAQVDLRQFLPGGKKDPSRSLAGISGPDGITGPNSNIFQKINIRYFSISETLLP